jgi:hypothetical protein
MHQSITNKMQYLPSIFTSQYFPVHGFTQLHIAIIPVAVVASKQLPYAPHGLGLHEFITLKRKEIKNVV